MIHAWKPEHFKTLHPSAPRENILGCVVKNVAECQHASDVRRRHHDRE